MKTYCVGFMFSQNLQRVALIRKTHPDWQAGKLNGIGGEIDSRLALSDEMVREFAEETGLVTSPDEWNYFADKTGHDEDWLVYFCYCRGDIDCLVTQDEERIVIEPVRDVHPYRSDMLPDLPYLIARAHYELQCEKLPRLEQLGD